MPLTHTTRRFGNSVFRWSNTHLKTEPKWKIYKSQAVAYFVVNPVAELWLRSIGKQEKARFPTAVVKVTKEVTTGSAYKMNSEQVFFRLTGFVAMEGLRLLLRMWGMSSWNLRSEADCADVRCGLPKSWRSLWSPQVLTFAVVSPSPRTTESHGAESFLRS